MRREVVLVESQPGRLVDQEPAITRARGRPWRREGEPDCCSSSSLRIPLGPLGDRQLGVVGRAGGRVAQEGPAGSAGISSR